MKEPWMEELEKLEQHPELAHFKFPFRGHIDFRGFTQDDYENFPGGVYVNTENARKARWFGGRLLADAAEAKLVSLGYAVVRQQHSTRGWINLSFTPKSVPADYCPGAPINITV